MKDKYFSVLFLLLFVVYLFMIILYEVISETKPELFNRARLEKVKPENGKFEVFRNNKRLVAEVGMELECGDTIKNSDETNLEIGIKTLQLTTEGLILKDVMLVLGKNSGIRISKSGIKIISGPAKVYVNTRKYSFAVETKYVKAGTEGTEFIVATEPHEKWEEKVTVIVADGTVWVRSKGGDWDQIELISPARCVIYGKKPPDDESVLESRVEEAFRWARDIRKTPAKHEFFWDNGFTGITYEWYVRIKADQLVKHQRSYNLFHGSYTNDVSELKRFRPGAMKIRIISASANCFEAEIRHPKIPGYMWTADCERNVRIIKEDPNLASESETEILIAFILFAGISVFLFARVIRRTRR